MMRKWQYEEFQEPAAKVAPKLLGSYLVHVRPDTTFVGRIVETEAYGGTYRRQVDDGAHSHKGLTARTEPMFCAGGIAYVYLIYGMYHCMNIVTASPEDAQAVLIRAVEPVDGIERMLVNRKATKVTKNLTNGPGKLCMAMEIGLAENKIDLCGESLFILHGESGILMHTERSRRINIDYAVKGKYFPWRFYIKNNPFVSKG